MLTLFRSRTLPDLATHDLSPVAPGPVSPTVVVAPQITTEKPSTARGNILFAVGVLLFLAVAYKIAKELQIIYVSALFAVVLAPVVRGITKWNLRGYRPGTGMAVVILLVGTLLALAIFFRIGLPPVLGDAHNFLVDAPHRIPQMAARVKKLPLANYVDLDTLSARAENFAGAVGAYLLNAAPGWVSHILDILTTLFLTIYFILEGDHAYDFFLSLFRPDSRKRLDTTLRKAGLKMSKWLFGQGLLMLVMGVTFTIAFGILHVRYFLLLGVLMGLFNIIPVAGAAITVTLSMLVAAIDSWGKVLAVLIVYLVYVNVENVFLTPRIMKSSLNMLGLTVLISLLIGTSIAGVVGALVAVPTAALVTILLEEYAVKS